MDALHLEEGLHATSLPRSPLLVPLYAALPQEAQKYCSEDPWATRLKAVTTTTTIMATRAMSWQTEGAFYFVSARSSRLFAMNPTMKLALRGQFGGNSYFAEGSTATVAVHGCASSRR